MDQMSRDESEQRNAGPCCKPRRSTRLCSRRTRSAPVQARLNVLAHLPDRSGWLWLKSQTVEAIKLQTTSLTIPSGASFNAAVERLRNDPGFGQRQGHSEYLVVTK